MAFQKGNMRKRKKQIRLQAIKSIDYKDVALLKKAISERGKILPRRVTGTSAKAQEN